MLRANRLLMAASSCYINPRVVEAQYAVRGLIPTRADELKQMMANGQTLKFKELIYCNIGNPQALDQPPLSFYREVTSLVDCPTLLATATKNPSAVGFSETAVARAKEYISKIGNKTGAYTDSTGYVWAREEVAKFIKARDAKGGSNLPDPSPAHIILTDGASTGVRLVMTALVAGKEDAVMIPIPQYPLYTAQIALLGGTPAMYYLDESRGWSLSVPDLEKSYADAKAKGSTPRLLVVINPGNPTGQVLDRTTMEGIVKFCHEKNLLLLADEVYQENIYAEGKVFHSFREVVLSSEKKIASETMLVSLHSTSKGIIGECGRRGGYFEILNLPTELSSQIIKLCSINLCSNVNGQVMTSLMCHAPEASSACYPQFKAEYDAIFQSLKLRAVKLEVELNKIRGITCNPVEGAMYAFPKLVLPAGYVKHNDELNTAAKSSIPVDARWALELLEGYGVVVVPGSGFGQAPGTLHFRTTILPSPAQMDVVVSSIRSHQDDIYARFSS